VVPNHSHPDARVKGSKKETFAGGQTREQILLIASNLFAAQGYHGTTTREIARAVGIRQPSLFHHFDSKAAIMSALLAEDLGRSVVDREVLARTDDPAGVRLFRYVVHEVVHIATSRFNMAGIHSEEVRTTPELQSWYKQRSRLHRAIDRIVQDGKSAGEFVDISNELVRASILGALERAVFGYSAGKIEFNPAVAEQVASLLVRAVLADPTRLSQIRETALAPESVSAIYARTSKQVAADDHVGELISDSTWRVVAPALPPPNTGRGGQRRNDRQILEAIAWRFANSSSWRDLPPHLGPWQTAWKRYAQWREDGTWDRFAELIAQNPSALRELAWLIET
jgi:AcrR family transcriptional regulator